VTKKAILVLADSSVYQGQAFGAETTTHGEVVFSTSMTGYQEMLTDPLLLRKLIGKKPIMGRCLGHQLIGKALGAKTFKLKFGHRGGNHPVRDLATGRVYITAQNHGYAVDADTLKGGLEVSHINLNDGTVEGLRHRDLPILSIQYHPQASPGPLDNMYLFERFLDMVRGI
jgi:carbamoyl-phosphate synthase small subunit